MTANKQTKKFVWQTAQDRLANDGGVSVVTVDRNSTVLAESNNNSICRVLYNSEEFAASCDKFCGRAFEMADEAGKTVEYKCYAGLNCRAVPVREGEKQLVTIVGRTFLKSQDYRIATQRAISGDWQKYPRTKFFENVILSGSSKHLETVVGQLQNLSDEEKDALFLLIEAQEDQSVSERSVEEEVLQDFAEENLKISGQPEVIQETLELTDLIEDFIALSKGSGIISEKIEKKNTEEAEEMAAWRSLFNSLLDLSYKKACISILQFLQKRHSISSIAWLERYENQLETTLAGGTLKEHPLRFKFSVNDKHLLEASAKGTPLKLRLRPDKEKKNSPRIIQLYPIGVGGEIRSALVTGDDEITNDEIKRQISRFCREVASDIEILRLREELLRRERLERAVQIFNESVKHIDSADFWTSLAEILSELLKSERSSLLIFDEKSDSLLVKAATGSRAEFIKTHPEKIGERIAKNVLKKGKPHIRRDIRDNGENVAPSDWKYKSNSFISYPIKIAGREIGVLNVTDKSDGQMFDHIDMELLDVIVPHLAVLMDRALLKQKAGEFEHLSVTDALTGLLNRRYLEERVTEEIQRSNRHGYPMSFMMIDVDDFKSYNDAFTHLEGDRALRIVGRCLKEILRGADVAARYGGEEFSILLPQTNSFEAETIAERIRQKVAMTRFPNRPVTVSIGIVSASANVNTAEDLIWAADTALYEAKRQGKNNVQIYEQLNLDEISEIEKNKK